MKKAIACVLLPLLLISLSACAFDNGFVYEHSGMEEFSTSSEGSMEITAWLLPSEDFPTLFPTTDSYYHYLFTGSNEFIPLYEVERSLMILTYDESDYEQAKEYCLTNMELSDTVVLEYNGYHFIENLVAHRHDDWFPWWINMLVYNDERHQLGFLGLNRSVEDIDRFLKKNGWPKDDRGEAVCSHWGEYVTDSFAPIWDFDNGCPPPEG